MDTYRATNTKNGKFYIGSTNNFEKRKKGHLKSKETYPFQSALRKDPDSFIWEVWSDDSDEPILEQALLDMWFGKGCCYNLNPSASRPPIRPEVSKINGNNNKLKRRGIFDPEYLLSKECRTVRAENGKKGAATCKERNIGIFNPEWRTSEAAREMYLKNGKKNGKRNGRKIADEKRGFCSPENRERKAKMQEKKVKAISPEGEIFSFDSAKKAADGLNIPRGTLPKLARRGVLVTKGKWEGWLISYIP
jgi:group I intron endonuclease